MADDVIVKDGSPSGALRALLDELKTERYLRLMGKTTGVSIGTGLLLRRLPPALGVPIAFLAGIYCGLEIAAYITESTEARGPMLDATAVEVPMSAGELAGDDRCPDSLVEIPFEDDDD